MNASSGSGLWPTRRTGVDVVAVVDGTDMRKPPLDGGSVVAGMSAGFGEFQVHRPAGSPRSHAGPAFPTARPADHELVSCFTSLASDPGAWIASRPGAVRGGSPRSPTPEEAPAPADARAKPSKPREGFRGRAGRVAACRNSAAKSFWRPPRTWS